MCADAKSSKMSLRRTRLPLIEYSLTPSRKTVRSMLTSSKSRFIYLFELSKTILTEARLARGESLLPFQIMSSPFLPRIDFKDCSPNTNRKASATFDFPEPFGPTIEVIGVLNLRSLFLAKDFQIK